VERFVALTASRARASLDDAARFDTDTLLSLRESLSRWSAASARARLQDDKDALAIALAFACRYGGPWDLADEALSTLQSPEGHARTLRGEYAARLGRLAEAEQWLQGVEHPPACVAWARMLLARLHAASGKLESALQLAQHALSLAESDAVSALALDVMGTIWRMRGDPERVREHYDRALGRLLDPSFRLVRAVVAQNQAASLGALGLHEEGIVGLTHALDALMPLPVPHLVAVVRGNLALALLAAGRAEEAAPLLEVALGQARRSGDRRSAAKDAIELALARAMLGKGPEAEQLANEARELGAEPVRVLMVSAWAALARGEPTLAIARLTQALAACRGQERREVWPLLHVVASKAGDLRLAERLRSEQREYPPLPELAAWMEAQGPRPELALVAGARLPLDTWAVWAALRVPASPGL
jgi:tetratricopeptide (TPR) repeat protein